jgi:hypothetical protein
MSLPVSLYDDCRDTGVSAGTGSEAADCMDTGVRAGTGSEAEVLRSSFYDGIEAGNHGMNAG